MSHDLHCLAYSLGPQFLSTIQRTTLEFTDSARLQLEFTIPSDLRILFENPLEFVEKNADGKRHAMGVEGIEEIGFGMDEINWNAVREAEEWKYPGETPVVSVASRSCRK
jgi:hypothetical protein